MEVREQGSYPLASNLSALEAPAGILKLPGPGRCTHCTHVLPKFGRTGLVNGPSLTFAP